MVILSRKMGIVRISTNRKRMASVNNSIRFWMTSGGAKSARFAGTCSCCLRCHVHECVPVPDISGGGTIPLTLMTIMQEQNDQVYVQREHTWFDFCQYHMGYLAPHASTPGKTESPAQNFWNLWPVCRICFEPCDLVTNWNVQTKRQTILCLASEFSLLYSKR